MSKQHKVLKDSFSSALYHARVKYDYTQSELSERGAISPRAYEDLELGKSLPSFRTFVNIAIACNLDANALITKIKENGYVINDEANAK